jgi:hypothetical protein
MAFVIPVGFFRELKHGHAKGGSLREAVQPAAGADDARAVKYLSAGVTLVASAGVVKDVLDPKAPVIGSPDVLTDGTYAWPSDLAHYVEKHHARLPAELLAHMAANHWTVPAVDTAGLELGEERDAGAIADYRQQGEDIARAFLKAYEEYDDPEVAARRAAREAEDERRFVAGLDEFYIKTGQHDPSIPLDDAVSQMLRYFAGRIERETPDIGAVTLEQPLPDAAVLELGATPDGKRYLLLRVARGSGRTVSERVATGSKDQLVAMLRTSATARALVKAMQKLAGT